MDTIELLRAFADPEVIATLSLSQRLTAGLFTTILGMGITFVALILLQFVIMLMARFGGAPKSAPAASTAASTALLQAAGQAAVPPADAEGPGQDEELVAAVTAALALQLKTSVDRIVVREIERVEGQGSPWQRAGLAEQLNSPF